MKILHFVLYFSICLILSSCTSKSYEDFRNEGESISKSLIQELRKIKSKKDFSKAKSKLQKLFNDMVDTIIEAEMFYEANSIEALDLTKENHDLSDQLRSELNRLYQIPGGYEFIEKCQGVALQRLDSYKKGKIKKKNRKN